MIQVNGDAMEWQAGLTVRDVLEKRNYRFPLLIISINGEWVDPNDYKTTIIPDAADVQVMHMISGG